MNAEDLLLIQSGAVLALMLVLVLLKRHTRRIRLDKDVRRYARSSRFIPIGPADLLKARAQRQADLQNESDGYAADDSET